MLLLFEDKLIVVRDRHGLRPLAIGELNGAKVFASETCAFDLIGATYLRDVAPGELIEVNRDGTMRSLFPFGFAREAPCIFEFVYFARPDSG